MKQGLPPLITKLLEIESHDATKVIELLPPLVMVIQEDDCLLTLLEGNIHSTLIKLIRQHRQCHGIIPLSLLSIRLLCVYDHVPKLIAAGVVDVLIGIFKDTNHGRYETAFTRSSSSSGLSTTMDGL